MGRRYYCEYCDKTFPDNPTNRKNHLKGVQHRALQKQHYDFFQEPEVTLTEDSGKKPCRAFQQEGRCKFGSACIYSHLTDADRAHLRALVSAKQSSSRHACPASINSQSEHEAAEALLSDWLERRSQNVSASVKQHSESADFNQQDENKSGKVVKQINFSLPDCLRDIDNLPASLLPPDPRTMNEIEDCGWG